MCNIEMAKGRKKMIDRRRSSRRLALGSLAVLGRRVGVGKLGVGSVLLRCPRDACVLSLSGRPAALVRGREQAGKVDRQPMANS